MSKEPAVSESLREILGLARLTLLAPRQGAKQILTLKISRNTLWQSMALVVSVSVLLAWVNMALAPSDLKFAGEEILSPSPFAFALLLTISMFCMVFGIYLIGRIFGGAGRFDDVLLLVIWLQVVMILLQLFQTVLMLLLPSLAGLAGLLGIGLLAWLLTNFTTVVHGFSSLGKVFLAILGVFFGISYVIVYVLALLGVEIAGSV